MLYLATVMKRYVFSQVCNIEQVFDKCTISYFISQDEEMCEEEDSHWQNPILVKFVCIFVVTQFVVHHVEMFEEPHMQWYNMICTMMQLLFLFGAYIYRIVTKEQNSAW